MTDQPAKTLVWLASYPKSGNTWYRIFLSNLLSGKEMPQSINNMYYTAIASSREIFEQATGISSTDLTFDEIDALRPQVFRFIASTNNGPSFSQNP
ncbi:MAG: hypothetical protein HC896_05435 [Bacteroidales bacterium]|nr:hypothetical protein [Bacteroidales bacterium]